MGTYSPAVTCYEEFGTQKEGIDLASSPNGSVTLRCAWGDRYLLIADLLGNQRAWPNGTAVNPMTARSAAIKTFDTQFTVVGQSIIYQDALVDVNYGYETRDLFSESLEPTADFITLDHRYFRWGSAAGECIKQGEAPGRLRRGMNLLRTNYNVSAPLSTQLLTAIGGVNDTAYTSTVLGLTFPIGTLLFTPPVLDMSVDTLGSDGWTVAMKFMYRAEGWNSYWRAKTQSYDDIYIAGGGQYLNYPLEDMTDLIF